MNEALDEGARYLFAGHAPELQRFARGRLPRWARDVADTPDLVQETLLQGVQEHRSIRTPRGRRAPGLPAPALLNRVRDELRKATRRPPGAPLPVTARDEAASPLEEAIGRQAVERYEASLARLHEDDRELVIARLELGLSYADIAASTGRSSANAARMAVVRALLRLSQELGNAGAPD
jgi:RNA polymerase sigma factor (sigma-70 family)